MDLGLEADATSPYLDLVCGNMTARVDRRDMAAHSRVVANALEMDPGADTVPLPPSHAFDVIVRYVRAMGSVQCAVGRNHGPIHSSDPADLLSDVEVALLGKMSPEETVMVMKYADALCMESLMMAASVVLSCAIIQEQTQ